MITINTNTAASLAAFNLRNTTAQLQQSLNKLSSGSRINSSFDDAGGLAVSMKLSAAIRRTEATQANVNNAMSFLQTQDGVLKNADKVVTRMAELVQLSTDITKSTSDRDLYRTEFENLQGALGSMLSEQFNGIGLFTAGGVDTTVNTDAILSVVVSQDGGQSVAATQLDFGALGVYMGTAAGSDINGVTLDDVFQNVTTAAAAITTVTTAIQTLATLRAYNGAEQSRISFAADMLAINKTNLESANSRILDVDIAKESSNLARLSILQQAGTAMAAQANQSQQAILALLT